ncbi:protein O-GlcNAcase [Alphaproteobacteria bacterium]|nr:protein O-GlcNAcase [Alphaproteobacteria bacterium]
MKKNMNMTGYIEGFYGQLLSWESRKRIINSLSKNRMNFYFYAPKEDINHRFNWRNKYNLSWRSQFKDFTKFGKQKNINIIAGIAPGLDFNFKNLTNNSIEIKKSDFNFLYNKSKQLLKDGASAIALLLDDIPSDFEKNFGNEISEGTSHAILANKLSQKLNQEIYFVPRIYADELIKDSPKYLLDVSKTLNRNIYLFYCGKNVISKTITIYSKIEKMFPNKIIYWDNYYANDYCPRRLFIGPYIGRKGLNNVMINLTGLINTDLLILDIIANTKNKKHPYEIWLKTLKNHGVPLIFNKLKIFFLKPDFGSEPSLLSLNISSTHFEALEFLLWSWKSKLSREWYPYLFGLKQDLQINEDTLSSERLIKTQTLPLAQHINIT